MQESNIELGLYYNCFDEIKRRIHVIADHLNKVTMEKNLYNGMPEYNDVQNVWHNWDQD